MGSLPIARLMLARSVAQVAAGTKNDATRATVRCTMFIPPFLRLVDDNRHTASNPHEVKACSNFDLATHLKLLQGILTSSVWYPLFRADRPSKQVPADT